MDASLEYGQDYAPDARARGALRDFLVDLHGLDLGRWEERVGWDPRFVPFSFFEGDRVVASASIYSIDMRLRGEWRRVAQISSVGTRPEWRRRGLNTELTRRALEWASAHGHAGTFLFSNDDAVGFYRKQGFTEQAECRQRIEVRATPRPGARRLHYDRDEELIRRLVESRTPVSELVGTRCPRLELFHLLYGHLGEMRYLEDFDLLVVAEPEDDGLEIYDLIGPRIPPWKEIEPWLVDATTHAVSFAFSPDRLALEGAETVEDRSSHLHVLEEEGLFTGRFMVPWTAHA
jgi:GNAT superfamily N-acetyltransferase